MIPLEQLLSKSGSHPKNRQKSNFVQSWFSSSSSSSLSGTHSLWNALCFKIVDKKISKQVKAKLLDLIDQTIESSIHCSINRNQSIESTESCRHESDHATGQGLQSISHTSSIMAAFVSVQEVRVSVL